jgi:AcrR family transcriptional regulator
MNQIAEAAGVTKPVLYQHFRSKRELYRELLADVGRRLDERIAKAAVSAPGPRQQVEAGFLAYVQFVEQELPAFRLLFGAAARHDPEFAEVTRQTEGAIVRRLVELIDVPSLPEEERELFAYGLVGLAEATSRRWVAGDLPSGVDATSLAQRMADLAWAGLRGIRTQ